MTNRILSHIEKQEARELQTRHEALAEHVESLTCGVVAIEAPMLGTLTQPPFADYVAEFQKFRITIVPEIAECEADRDLVVHVTRELRHLAKRLMRAARRIEKTL